MKALLLSVLSYGRLLVAVVSDNPRSAPREWVVALVPVHTAKVLDMVFLLSPR